MFVLIRSNSEYHPDSLLSRNLISEWYPDLLGKIIFNELALIYNTFKCHYSNTLFSNSVKSKERMENYAFCGEELSYCVMRYK